MICQIISYLYILTWISSLYRNSLIWFCWLEFPYLILLKGIPYLILLMGISYLILLIGIPLPDFVVGDSLPDFVDRDFLGLKLFYHPFLFWGDKD